MIRGGGAGFSRGEATICAPAASVRVRIRPFASLASEQVSTEHLDVIGQCSDVPPKTHGALPCTPVRDVSGLGNGMCARADGCVGLVSTSATPQYGLADGET